MQKPLVFISHIGEEKAIAIALKNLVESSFLDMMEVFVSSDPTSIPVGQKWLERITDGLRRCAVEIIIASPLSVQRPWINFEAGSGWIREIPVIPLCHSGMTHDRLPQPLSYLQAAVATDEAALKLLFPVLAKAIGCGEPAPDFAEFIQSVREFEATSNQLRSLRDPIPTYATNGLAGHEAKTLIQIAEDADSFGDGVGMNYLARTMQEQASLRPLMVKLAVKSLERNGLIEIKTLPEQYGNGTYEAVVVTDGGWTWLQANHASLPSTVVAGNNQKQLQPNEQPSRDVPF